MLAVVHRGLHGVLDQRLLGEDLLDAAGPRRLPSTAGGQRLAWCLGSWFLSWSNSSRVFPSQSLGSCARSIPPTEAESSFLRIFQFEHTSITSPRMASVDRLIAPSADGGYAPALERGSVLRPTRFLRCHYLERAVPLQLAVPTWFPGHSPTSGRLGLSAHRLVPGSSAQRAGSSFGSAEAVLGRTCPSTRDRSRQTEPLGPIAAVHWRQNKGVGDRRSAPPPPLRGKECGYGGDHRDPFGCGPSSRTVPVGMVSPTFSTSVAWMPPVYPTAGNGNDLARDRAHVKARMSTSLRRRLLGKGVATHRPKLFAICQYFRRCSNACQSRCQSPLS